MKTKSKFKHISVNHVSEVGILRKINGTEGACGVSIANRNINGKCVCGRLAGKGEVTFGLLFNHFLLHVDSIAYISELRTIYMWGVFFSHTRRDAIIISD